MPVLADPGCVFCAIVAGRLPSLRLHDDDRAMAFVDINPANDGHCLAIAKGHWPTLHDIPADTLGHVASVAQRVAAAVRTALAPEGINLIQANGPGAGQSVPHFHIHILPRRAADGLAINWPQRPGERARLEAVHARLLAAMPARTD